MKPMKTISNLTVMGALAASWLVTTSCQKSSDSSDLKTLDQLSGLDQTTINSCQNSDTSIKPTSKLRERIQASRHLEATILNTLTSVPPHLANTYFASGGAIVANSRAFTQCLSQLSEEGSAFASGYGKQTPSSCWQLNDGIYTLYLPEKAELIAHGLVRGFAMILVQTMAPAAAEADDGLNKDKHLLGKSFGKDLASLSQVYPEKLREAVERSKRLSSENREVYANEVFAESFDSFYCNKATHKAMRERFPETYTTFLNKVHGRLVAPMAPVSESQDSMQLTFGLFGSLFGNLQGKSSFGDFGGFGSKFGGLFSGGGLQGFFGNNFGSNFGSNFTTTSFGFPNLLFNNDGIDQSPFGSDTGFGALSSLFGDLFTSSSGTDLFGGGDDPFGDFDSIFDGGSDIFGGGSYSSCSATVNGETVSNQGTDSATCSLGY